MHRLDSVDVERYNLEHFLFDSSHIHERAVIHQIEPIVISDNEKVILFIVPDPINSSHEALRLPFLGVSVLRLLKFSGDLLSVNRLTESRVILWNDWASRVNDV